MSLKATIGAVMLATCGLLAACGSHPLQTFTDAGDDATTDDVPDITQPTFGDVVDTGPTCVNLECQIDKCGTTNINGTVYAPNGTLPLYNVIVYVPNAPVTPFVDGVQCDECGTVSGNPIVAALSDYQGNFELKNVPSGSNIPLIMQVGKWRR
jgi:hypothetical protein